jgi:hypothetical protein
VFYALPTFVIGSFMGIPIPVLRQIRENKGRLQIFKVIDILTTVIAQFRMPLVILQLRQEQKTLVSSSIEMTTAAGHNL